MVEEEGTVMVGLLVGLNVLDANLCLKGEDLDSQVNKSFGSKWNVLGQGFTQALQAGGELRKGPWWGAL